jgi:probable DNA repair protein
MTQSISLFDVTPIWPQLVSGQLILTPNQRLASRISKAYALQCQQNGDKVVVTPAVYSLNHWVERCWQQLLINADPLAISLKPLSTHQELSVWEQLLGDSTLGSALLRPAATAKVVASAYQTLVDWQQDLSRVDLRELFQADQDAAVLLNWIDQFEQHCADQLWLPRARITERVLKAFNQQLLPACGNILGIGFEDIAPLQRELVNKAGSFEHYVNAGKAGEVVVVSCDSAAQEIMAAAVWSKQVLKNDSAATVAIVVPELSQQRNIVERQLLEVYDPAFNQPLAEQGQPANRRNLPFNLSAGYPLLEAPIIQAAMNALLLATANIELDICTTICQSPFYCLDDEDQDKVQQLISLLYEQRANDISTARFRQLANKLATPAAGQSDIDLQQNAPWPFDAALQRVAALATRSVMHKLRPIDEWLGHFAQLLSAIGWPGKRRLDSIEFQQVTQWQQLLQTLSAQSLVLPPISYSDALAQLRGILSRSVYQAQSEDSSLQVLGTLEAAGLQFSHLWLMSMSEQQWPPAASPNPLLPFSLQREQAMPHATAERELEYAKNLSQRFIHSAQHIVVSSPAVIDDNPASISRLFSQFPRQSLQQLIGKPLAKLLPTSEIRRRHYESKQLEAFDAANAPVLHSEQKISGGSSVFASQSACPFRAFVSHRLNIKPLAEAETGLNAADRGSLLHRALELVWQKLKNQTELLQLQPQQLDSLCEDVSRYTLDEFSQLKTPPPGPRYKQLECTRLRQLIKAWLVVEKSRANFEVVTLEDKKQFQFGALQLQARIDRIDKLDDGSLLIIDYKTGISNIRRWWGERPDEPQLPLYSMLTDTEQQPVGGIAFAQVRADGCSLAGVGAEQLAESTVKWQSKHQSDSGATDWSQLKQHWQRVLTALADDFVQGKSVVDPKSTLQSCQYCHFASVCRINHQQAASA